MKKVMFLILFALVMGNYIFSQQSHLKENNAKVVYPMAIFEPNQPQNVLETSSVSKKVKFQLFASENFKNDFVQKTMTNPMVIACNYDKSFKAGTLVNIDLSSEMDFDSFKSLLISSGIQYVSVEDTLLPINSWHPFTKEQMLKIAQLNLNIYNIEAKRNWVLNHPEQLEMAKTNGWFDENTQLLKNARKEKKMYINEILN